MNAIDGRREIKSLKKALTVLECVISNPAGISLANISRETGINRNTAFQILTTLCVSDYLFQDPISKNYFSGAKLLWISTASDASGHLLTIAKPVLAELTRETQETSHLAILDGRYVRFLAKEDSPLSLVVVTNLDKPIEVQRTSVGKAILSYLPEKQIERILDQISYSYYTENSICSVEKMKEELSVTKLRGYAVDDEESFIGVRCVAAPVFDAQNNVLCAIGISAPTVRMPNFRTAAAPVLKAAEKLNAILCGGK